MRRRREMLIGKKMVGESFPVYVIAEIGVNHDGSLQKALRLVDAAVDAGADAVKFQTFRADRLMAVTRDRLPQQEDGSETAFEMFRRLELSREAHEKLKRHADSRGTTFLSTPFDEESVDFLDKLGVPAFKIASADVTHFPLLRHAASKGKPVLLSTGMSFLNEVGEALWEMRSSGAREVAVLHCVSIYPAIPESLNLRAITTLREQFDLPVGFSDHSEGTLMPVAAVALGAVIVEKHLTLGRSDPGPDHKLSLEPEEFRKMVTQLRAVEVALGDGRKRPTPGEEEGRLLGRRSIIAAVDIRALETIAPWMLTYKRPGTGLAPRDMGKIVGTVARRDISKDSVLQWEDITLSPDQDTGVDPPPDPDSREPAKKPADRRRSSPDA